MTYKRYTKNQRRKRRSKRRLTLLSLLVVIAVLVSLQLFKGPANSSTNNSSEATELLSKTEDSAPRPLNTVYPDKKIEVFDVKVRREDTLYSILRAKAVGPEEILRIARLSKKVYNLSRIKLGDHLRLTLKDGQLDRIDFRYDDLHGLVVKRSGSIKDGFVVKRYTVPYTKKQVVIAGTIRDSLYESGVRAGVAPTVIAELSDIFAWDVDFATDIRKGDSFKVIYETIYVDGKPLRTGRINAAELTNKGKQFYALYYEDLSGRGEYFNRKGQSLSRTLLRSPLSYRRISSHFSRRRYHPILKRYRPHHGIDYAAPVGTPVESSGSGRVVFAGWKRGYGKFIKIRHNEKYTTAYGHLSKITKGIRKGVKVSQGMVIGKVGSTGNSTGPHLHYEVVVWGKVVDPLSIKSKSRRSLNSKEKIRFEVIKRDLVARLGKAGVVVAMVDSR